MSKEMKAIFENYRKGNLLNEAKIETAKDFVQVLQAISMVKKGEKLGSGAARIVGSVMGLASADELMNLLAMEPNEILAKMGDALGVAGDIWGVITGSKDIGDTMKNLTKLPDEKAKKAGFLGILDINDNYLKMIDNRLENAIINDLIRRFVNLGDANIEDMDLNGEFAKSVKKVLGGTETITGAPEKRMGDQKKIGKGAVTKDRLKQATKIFGDRERD
jgi:hypothetical protein